MTNLMSQEILPPVLIAELKWLFNSVNATMNNPQISAKKKLGILTKFMKNKKAQKHHS